MVTTKSLASKLPGAAGGHAPVHIADRQQQLRRLQTVHGTVRYLSAAISPTVITPSSYAQRPTSVSFLDIERRCHVALWRCWIFAPCPSPFRSFLVSPDRVLFSSSVESGPAIRQWHRDPGTGGVHNPLQHSSESVPGRGHSDLGFALSRCNLGGWNPLFEGHFPPSTQCSGSQINSATIGC
jgi:hypothetical protein